MHAMVGRKSGALTNATVRAIDPGDEALPEQKALSAVSRRTLIAGFVLFSIPGLPALGKESSSMAFLASIYRHYIGSSVGVATGMALPDAKAVRGYFTVGLTSLIIDDRFAGTRDGEPPILDVDPFVGCQDWEISNLAIQVKEIGAKATGIVAFINAGKPQKVVLELQRSSDGWRIAEIQWDYASLRGLFRSRAAYNGEGPVR
jgi:hypothetical protein